MEWREGEEGLKKILRLRRRPSLLMLKQQYFLGPPVPEGWCSCTKDDKEAWMGSSTSKGY